ncbi:D-methionine transport system ATP-binding protein [Pseudoxanthomonas winnipegensis]|uniref:Cell division ATP-binding protein FtsE n=1 Tax=Pseudoxanthomonas winnipegensis TaxID=2480810 RepID=A0AAW8GEN2_9GAMM|nr:ATP-binding cassette domain-containing protein [Pseudoxanthomonas winnipegensis]MDQ1120925.1 D-methionine transport system ATP-binding protein [Pseudoxanthomonas winnipegensis]MDQ1134151.1 D-methionine transport system ATP-binding protein [Pseudoxanthomonas winnipegensis]
MRCIGVERGRDISTSPRTICQNEISPFYFPALTPAQPVISFQHVSKSYRSGGREIHALRGIDLEVHRGEVLGVIGHSGAGKSSLLRLINGLETPTSGAVRVEGQAVDPKAKAALIALRRRIGMIFQHFNLLSAQTAAGNVAFPLRLAGLPQAQVEARVRELLARVGLEQQATAYPAQLSGGQKQRVGIARALATGPSILLCDEATSALDPQTTASVLDLLSDLNRELGLTIVLITHEMEVVRRICDRVVVLDGGRVVEEGAVSEVFLHPQHPTTRTFLNDDAAGVERIRAGEGQQLLRVTLVGEQVHSPVLGATLRALGAEYFITSGRVDTLKHLPYGQVTLSVDAQLSDAVVQRLAEQGVHAQAVTP